MSSSGPQDKQPPPAELSGGRIRPALVEGASHRNTEVREPKRRRVLSPQWKLDFLRRYDSCRDQTEKGKLVRSEGVYLSQVSQWKKDLREGRLSLASGTKRGPTAKTTKEMSALQQENARLKKELTQARQIIELQKKVAALFGTEDNS